MARSLEFVESDALTAAMHVFRRRGYGGVSIKVLEAETGLSSGSMYNSFGGKEAIFARALAHYNDTVVKKRIADHLGTNTPVDGLVSLFVSLFEEPGGTAYGCLLTNSAVEFAGMDHTATTEIRRGFELLLTAFKTTLLGIPAMQNSAAEEKSVRLLTYYQGLLVLIRHGHNPAALRHSVRPEILSILGETNVE